MLSLKHTVSNAGMKCVTKLRVRRLRCPLWVKSGLMQCSKRCLLRAKSGHPAHSTTSSALAGIYSARVAGQKLRASQQSAMTLASDQDRDTSGKSRTQARSLTHLDRRILSGCSQEQGDIDHVRL